MNEKYFENESSLILEDYDYLKRLPSLDLSSFPIIEDFEIKTKNAGTLGVHLFFNSPTHGILAGFPWWDNVDKDLKKMTTQTIPLGQIDAPFDDLEQGWQILVWEKDDWVYVMEGDDPCCVEFPRWFKVGKAKYLSEWTKVIDHFH